MPLCSEVGITLAVLLTWPLAGHVGYDQRRPHLRSPDGKFLAYPVLDDYNGGWPKARVDSIRVFIMDGAKVDEFCRETYPSPEEPTVNGGGTGW